jgi:hypothetical protein
MLVVGFPLDHSLTAQGPILGRRTQKGGLGGGGEAHCGECFCGFLHYLWFVLLRCVQVSIALRCGARGYTGWWVTQA